MKIYFDNVLIDQEYYMGLSQDGNVFYESDSFCLGKTLCNAITIQIANSGVSSIPTEVKLMEDTTTYGYYMLDSYTKENGYYEFNLTDKMVKFNFNYSAKSIIDASSTGYVTLLAILQDICTKGGVTLASNSTTFYGYDKHISWYDDSITARDYIGYIAELNAGFARINKSGELELVRMSNTPVQTINTDDCEYYDIGEYHKISKVVCDDGLGTFTPVGDTTNDTLYLDPNNVYITLQSDLTTIYNAVKNYEFYSVEIDKCPISSSVLGLDSLKLTDGTNNYYFFAQLENEYNGGWVGGYEFKVSSPTQAETSITGTTSAIKSIKTTIDRDEASMSVISTKVDNLEESVDVLKVELDSNVVVVSTDSTKKPTSTKTYEVGYSVKYLGSTITLQPTTSSSYTGITCTIANDKISFGVNSSIAITNLDNKYTFTWTYGTYTITRTIMVSVVVAPESEQQIYEGSTAPTDTSKLWLDTTEKQLKRYDSTTSTWEVINDYSDEIEAVDDKVDVNTSNLATLTTSVNSISSEVTTTKSQVTALGTAVTTIQSTMQEQTDTAITTYFTNTIKPLLDTMESDIANNKDDISDNTSAINTFQSYIREAIDTDEESPYYNMAYLEIGTSNNDVKVRLYPTVLSFYENGSEVAYISNNSLYITESTILTTLRLGDWIAVQDSADNLNIKWNGGN